MAHEFYNNISIHQDRWHRVPNPVYSKYWESEYGFTKELENQVRQFMSHHRDAFDCATHLAEETAIELGHEEWLDEETHPIWDLALYYFEEEC